MQEYYPFFKAMHIVGFVSWFAGLFYLVRMFVYHAESKDKPEHLKEDWKKQFTLMQWRVYKIIATPAMIFTWFFGIGMIIISPAMLTQTWLQVKLGLLILLVIYHFFCKRIIVLQEKDQSKFSSFQFRLLNEMPTLFLVAIVLMAVAKNLINFLNLFGGILLFGLVLFLAARAYKKYRKA